MNFQESLNLWKPHSKQDPIQNFIQIADSEYDCAVNLGLALLLGEKTSTHLKHINRLTSPTYTKHHEFIRMMYLPDTTTGEMITLSEIQYAELLRLQSQWESRLRFDGFIQPTPTLLLLDTLLRSVALEALVFLVLRNDHFYSSWYGFRNALGYWLGSLTFNCGKFLRQVKKKTQTNDWLEITQLPLFELAKETIQPLWLL